MFTINVELSNGTSDQMKAFFYSIEFFFVECFANGIKGMVLKYHVKTQREKQNYDAYIQNVWKYTKFRQNNIQQRKTEASHI